MAIYDILNIDEITDLMASLYGMLMPEQNVARGSDNWKRIRAVALALGDNHAHVLAMYRNMLPDVAGDDGVLAWARALEIERKGAVAASGASTLRLVKTAVGSIPYSAGTRLRHSSQLVFELNASGTMSTTTLDVDVIAVTPGEAGNLPAGEELVFETPIVGIADTAELQTALTGGEDVEPIGQLRQRVLARIRDRGRGGAKADWLAWALAVTGVSEAYAYRHRDGLGTVDVVGLKKGAGSARFLNAGERTLLLAALDAVRPFTTTVRVLECEADAQAVKITVTPAEGEAYARDWNDSTPLTVSSYTSATRTLVFTADRPADMRAGDRICWDAASGELVEIEALSSTNAVVLRTDPSPAPTGTVYSGGPLTAQIQTAVKNLINGYTDDDGEYHWGLGPARGVWEPDWDDSVRPAKVLAAAAAVEGALDVDVDAPVSTYTPTDYAYPDDTKTRVVTPSYVFVKYAS